MKVKKEKKEKIKVHKTTDRGAIFVKIMAGILALLMVAGTAISVIYALIEG